MAGLKVLVLDQRPVAGGAAVTEEFSPGFRNSVASYAVSLLNPKIIRELDLGTHGLRIVERPISNFLPLNDGGFLKIGGSHTKREVAKFSARDAECLDDYQRQVSPLWPSANRGEKPGGLMAQTLAALCSFELWYFEKVRELHAH